MKILLLSLLLLYTHSFANYQYYYYDAKKVKVSNASFNRYVRSQARNIVAEYYNILKKLDPFHGELINIRKEILNLNVAWEAWLPQCSNKDPSCAKTLQDFYHQARELDRHMLAVQKQKLKHWGELNTNDRIDSLLPLANALDDISNFNYRTLHLLEELLITTNTQYFLGPSAKERLTPLIHQMQLTSDRIVTCNVPAEYKDEFVFLMATYIKQMEVFVSIKGDQDYLLNNMGTFNISWNIFHHKMSKGQYNIPANLLKTMTMMHNRWNWILKLYLKNTELYDNLGAIKS